MAMKTQAQEGDRLGKGRRQGAGSKEGTQQFNCARGNSLLPTLGGRYTALPVGHVNLLAFLESEMCSGG